jgi:hypothetical protein
VICFCSIAVLALKAVPTALPFGAPRFLLLSLLILPTNKMTLSDAEFDRIGQLFEDKVKAMQQTFNASLDQLGKRMVRVETAFSMIAGVARKVVTSEARSQHDRLLRETFDKSNLLALPQLADNPKGSKSRVAVTCSADDVKTLIASEIRDGDDTSFEVEMAKPAGFRILISSCSAQARRRVAAGIIKYCKGPMSEKLNLHLQYDKPYELRMLQKKAHQFLGTVKKRGGSEVTSTEAKKGFLLVNGIRVAPEYLVPDNRHWEKLAELVKSKMRGLRGPQAIVPELGFLYDVFGAALASDRGIFDLEEIPLDEEEFGEAIGGMMET